MVHTWDSSKISWYPILWLFNLPSTFLSIPGYILIFLLWFPEQFPWVVFPTICLVCSFPQSSQLSEWSIFKNRFLLKHFLVQVTGEIQSYYYFFFWFSFPSHLSFFLYTYPSLPGRPKFFSFVSPFTGTLLSSFILNINSILSLTSGHDSSLKLFRNRFPIDHAHCFHSV